MTFNKNRLIKNWPKKSYYLGIALVCGFLLISADDCENYYMTEQQASMEQRARAEQERAKQQQAASGNKSNTQSSAASSSQQGTQASSGGTTGTSGSQTASGTGSTGTTAGSQTASSGTQASSGGTTPASGTQTASGTGSTGTTSGTQAGATGTQASTGSTTPASGTGNTGTTAGSQTASSGTQASSGDTTPASGTQTASGTGSTGTTSGTQAGATGTQASTGSTTPASGTQAVSGGTVAPSQGAVTGSTGANYIASISGKSWKLTELRFTDRTVTLNRNELPADQADIFTLNIDNERISGRAAPNRYMTSYQAGANNALTIQPIASTMMALIVIDPQRIQEPEYFLYLGKVKSWKINQNKLELTTTDTANRALVMVFSN